MRSVLPRRSNCGPPSPKPRIGAAPVAKEMTPVSRSMWIVWTFSPLAVSTEMEIGSVAMATRSSPSFAVRETPRVAMRATGAFKLLITRVPSSGSGAGFPLSRGRTVSRKVLGVTGVSWISTSLPATRKGSWAAGRACGARMVASPCTARRRVTNNRSSCFGILRCHYGSSTRNCKRYQPVIHEKV